MRNKIIKWLKSKFQFVLRNDTDLKELIIYKFSNFQIIISTFLIFIIFFGISFYLSTTILRYWFDPRFAEKLANQQVINLSKTVDSLINESEIKENYIKLHSFDKLIGKTISICFNYHYLKINV